MRRCQQVPREEVPRELTQSENTFMLDHNMLTKNLKCARLGAAGGPSGMTAEHLKPLLDNFRDTELFCQVGEHLAQGKIPRDVLEIVRMGRMTALQKANGGVCGIVADDMVRRLVIETIAQQIRGPVERVTSPFQHALSTRAGTECIAHAIQAITDADPRATVLSVDGISTYDTISRVAMLRGLRSMEGGDALLPFVSQFYGSLSTYLWEDEEGGVHEIWCEGGEQGDALMPALFSLGQHGALEAIQARLRPSERLMAFLDDIWCVSSPERTTVGFTAIQEELLIVGIRVHDGKTQLWNSFGQVPAGTEALTGAAQRSDPEAIVWRGDISLPAEEQGVTVLGTPVGHPAYVRSRMAAVSEKHDS